jgi:hypothetical protein
MHTFMILRQDKLLKAFWSIGEIAFVPESDSRLVQEVLEKREPRVALYRENAKILWLLIVAGAGGIHSIIDFDWAVLTAAYSTSFDRVFLLRTFGSTVHELSVHQRAVLRVSGGSNTFRSSDLVRSRVIRFFDPRASEASLRNRDSLEALPAFSGCESDETCRGGSFTRHVVSGDSNACKDIHVTL